MDGVLRQVALSIALAVAPWRAAAQAPVASEECTLECERAAPCTAGPTGAGLAQALAAGELPRLDEVDRRSWASSTLAAEGKDPLRGSLPGRASGCALEAHARWTCRYAAGRAQDGDPRSAWCEGTPDDGVGEVLVARVDTSRPVEILAGLGASRALHAANGRPREVKVYVLQARERSTGQCGDTFGRVSVLADHRAVLRDVDGYQPLPLPAAGPAPGGNARSRPEGSFVAVEILSVYPGARHRDTCVSEIRNRPGERGNGG